jgi:CheY-like chemotaxis protein
MASCLILRKMIADLGFQCDIVGNGAEAVAAACKKSYDLIFMDLFMPVLNGMHATIAICSFENFLGKRPIIIGIASSSEYESFDCCKEAGMSALLLKPYHRESISRLIATLRPGASIIKTTETSSDVKNFDEGSDISEAARPAHRSESGDECESSSSVATALRTLRPRSTARRCKPNFYAHLLPLESQRSSKRVSTRRRTTVSRASNASTMQARACRIVNKQIHRS